MGEKELTAIVAKWVRKIYTADRGYKIDANCRHYNDTDIIVYKGEEKRVLQIEVKSEKPNQHIGVSEAMDYNMSDKKYEEIPTFLAVPIDAGNKNWRTWEYAKKLYKYYGIEIGVLAIDGQNVSVKHNPKHAKMW